MRSKLLLPALLLVVSAPSLLVAQTDRSNLQFYLSARYAGQASVTFNDVGTILSGNELGDPTSVMNRTYNDGYVFLDDRFTDDGEMIPADGRTNTWGFQSTSQVLPDGSGVSMNDYSTFGEDQSVSGDSEGSVGFDMEIAMRFGDYGAGGFGRTGPLTWGMSLGFGMNDVNARVRELLPATLNTTSDIYSLLGSTAPDGPYESPSFEDVTVTNPDGTTSIIRVNNTILLENTPLSRTVTSTPGGAEVDGYWEVDGTYFQFRLGPWFRWRPFDRLSIRASAGVSASLLGARMEYDERSRISDELTLNNLVIGEDKTFTGVGYYGYLDLEFWITDVTGFFAGVTYDAYNTDIVLTAGDRTADVSFTSGVGFRLGITTHF